MSNAPSSLALFLQCLGLTRDCQETRGTAKSSSSLPQGLVLMGILSWTEPKPIESRRNCISYSTTPKTRELGPEQEDTKRQCGVLLQIQWDKHGNFCQSQNSCQSNCIRSGCGKGKLVPTKFPSERVPEVVTSRIRQSRVSI